MKNAVLAVGLSAAVLMGASPIAAAETPTRFVLGGAEYALLDMLPALPLIDKYATRTPNIGRGFYPGTPAVQVDYPSSVFNIAAGNVGQHIATGADNLDAAIKASSGPLILAGQSQGSVVLNTLQARLENDPAAPAPDRLTFIKFNDPGEGLFGVLFRDGTRIPVVGVTVFEPVESRYDTIVVNHEYDFWSDFPDRPWNIPALLNAAMGLIYVHNFAEDVPADIPAENITSYVNSQGATHTTYLVPTPNLPLTETFRVLGVPDPIMDSVDDVLRPVIDAGYSRNDALGDPRPYLDRGALRFKPRPVAKTSAAAASRESGGRPETAAHARPNRVQR
jgi:hypothetical protein